MRFPRDVVLEVFELKERYPTMSNRAIAKKVGVGDWTVGKWLSNPFYSPYVDDVAVMRALEGERDVFQNLLYWERVQFYRALAATRAKMYQWEWVIYCRDLGRMLGISGQLLGDTLYAQQGGCFTEEWRPPPRPPARGRAVFRRAGYQMARRPW
jgi:hypothetical protein